MLRYICHNPVKAGLSKAPFEYPWLGCSGVRDDSGLADSLEGLTDLKGEALLDFVSQPSREGPIDDDGAKRLTDREASARLCRVSGCERVQEIAGWDDQRRDAAIRAALKSGISIRQLSRLTAISKAVIERVNRK